MATILSNTGIPALAKNAISKTSIIGGAKGILQNGIWAALKGQQQWGIYSRKNVKQRLGEKPTKEGFLQTAVDFGLGALFGNSQVSVISFALDSNSVVSDFPVEKGSFAQYNKVNRPNRISLTYAITGKEKDRMLFFNELNDAKNNNVLFDVAMPEFRFQGYTITDFSMARSAESGAQMFIFDVNLTEVKEVTAIYTKKPTANPADKQKATEAPKAPKAAEAKPTKAEGKTLPEAPQKGFLENIADKVTGALNKGRDAVIEGNKKYWVK